MQCLILLQIQSRILLNFSTSPILFTEAATNWKNTTVMGLVTALRARFTIDIIESYIVEQLYTLAITVTTQQQTVLRLNVTAEPRWLYRIYS